MERFMRENLAGKWFCAFALSERPPDHSFFGDFRQRPGTKRLMDLFNRLRDGLKEAGLIREVFTFVDAGKSVSKLSTRDDRDKAIARGLEKFNNETADQVAADPQARFGARGKDKFRYGCKEHTGVDMQSGLINRVAATPANVTDARGVRHVCPDQGAVFGDKGYCTQPAQAAPKRKGCHPVVNNNIRGALLIRETGQPDAGHGDIGRQPPDLRTAGRTGARPVARRFFCRWPCRTSRRFFSPPVSRKFRRDPFGGFPARFGRAFRFGRRGHFVSDDPSGKNS